jgi:hypothetical protein
MDIKQCLNVNTDHRARALKQALPIVRGPILNPWVRSTLKFNMAACHIIQTYHITPIKVELGCP